MQPLVIGASLGRTGTYSLKLALERLGYFPCLHMSDFAADEELCRLWLGELEKAEPDWETLLHGYKAVVDWPACNYLPSLLKTFPDARIIYTERPFENWYHSMSQTIVPALKWLKNIPEKRRSPFFELIGTEVLVGTFGNNLTRTGLKESYDIHRRHIVGLFRREQLLCVDIENGWAPICDYLQLSMPSEPFPRKNIAEGFSRFLHENVKRKVLQN